MSRHGVSPLLAAALTLGAAAVRAQPTTCTPPLVGADRLGPVTELARKGETLYVVAGAALLAVDVTDPAHPAIRSRLDLDFEPLELSVSTSVLAAAACERGVVLFDLTDPEHPVHAGELDTPGCATGVSSSPDRVFVADRGIEGGPDPRGLLIVDSSNPQTPVELGAFPFGSSGAVDVVAEYGLAYTLEQDGPLHLIGVSDPTHPIEVGSAPAPGQELLVGGAGQRVFVLRELRSPFLTTTSVTFVDATDPTDPRIRGKVELDSGGDGDRLTGFAIGAGRLYLGSTYEGLWTWDVTDLRHPVLLSVLEDIPASFDLVYHGGRIYSAAFEVGLQIYDLSEPTAPDFVAEIRFPRETQDALLLGATAATLTPTALRIFDVTDPADPIPVGGWLRPSTSVGVSSRMARLGDRVLVPGQDGLRIVDLSVPESPTEIGRLDMGDPVSCVGLRGDLAFLFLKNAHRLAVVDLSDPTQPLLIDTTPVLAGDCPLEIQDQVMVSGGCNLFDLSDPTLPLWAGDCGVQGGDALGLDLPYLYVSKFDQATQRASISTLDISDLNQPLQRGSVDFGPEPILRSSYRSQRAAVTSQTGEIGVLDLRDPDAPLVVGVAQGFDLETPVDFDRGRILVAQDRFGFAIYGDCPFFADGFESGDTSGWSNTQP